MIDFTPPSSSIHPTSAPNPKRKLSKQREAMDSTNPSTTRRMLPKEISISMKNTRHCAAMKYACWNSDLLLLPPLPKDDEGVVVGESIDDVEGQGFKERMLDLWEWYDVCFNVVEETYALSGLTSIPMTDMSPASLVKQESLLAAKESFSPPSRMKNLFGADYTAIMDCVDVAGVRSKGASMVSILMHYTID